jgi:hypothetical protein
MAAGSTTTDTDARRGGSSRLGRPDAHALAILAAVFDRLGRNELAATVAGFAISPLTTYVMSSATTATNHLPARASQ